MESDPDTDPEPRSMDPGPGLNGSEPEVEPATEPGGDTGERTSLAGRLVARGASGAQRVAGAAGVDRALEEAIEEAIVRAVESEATERAVARILNGPVVEQAVRDAISSDAVEVAVNEALDSDMVDRVWARVLESDETQLLIERIAQAPEVRAAIASQGIGLVDDLGRGVAGVTRKLDYLAERIARRLFFKSRRTEGTDRAGVVTRALALALDALAINLSLVTVTALVGLIASVFTAGPDSIEQGVLALGAAFWFGLSSLYLFTFWALSGQTPGMRFLDIRIEHEGRHAIGPRLAFRRLVGFWLASIPFCLGFVGVVLRLDRRGFHDRLGRTAVFYVDPTTPDQLHRKPAVEVAEAATPEPESVL